MVKKENEDQTKAKAAPEDAKETKVAKEPKKAKAQKEAANTASPKESKVSKEKKEPKQSKETKDSKVTKGGKAPKETEETKPVPASKKVKVDENLLYIVRIASKDLAGEKSVRLALSELKGVGFRLADIISRKVGIDPRAMIGSIGEEKIEKLKNYVEAKEFPDIPSWLLNHRNEIVSGKNLNLVSNDLDIQLQDDINYMRKTRSYKGVRHETGHKVRGQRTRSNGRKGLAVGVIKKKEGTPVPEKKE